MTLKEQICEPFGGLLSETANELEEIADGFAIGFAQWYEEEILAKGNYIIINKSKIELLKIYKKDKGL
jgi:hypothetical protein